MNKNIIVVDTNVLLEDRGVLASFIESDIIIPFIVLEELDNHKKDYGEVGANARSAIRQIDNISANGDIIKGVTLGTSTIKITIWEEKLAKLLAKHNLSNIPDNKIIITALAAGKSATLISNDICVRTKARLLGIDTARHDVDIAANSINDVYDGVKELIVKSDYIDNLHASGTGIVPEGVILFPNQFIRFISNVNESHTALGRFANGKIKKVVTYKNVSGISPRNVRQTFSYDVLFDQDIDLVTLIGKAGTGKTLIALSAAVEQVIERGDYDKIILVKAPVAMGPDIGFLPGELLSKILPHFESFLDNLYLLFPAYNEKNSEDLINHLIGTGKLELLPPTYMRGRSLSNTMVIVDEVQNLKREEVKTIATRIGEGSKLIMLGDINQVDRERLDGLHNGLAYLVGAFKDQNCAAHITFNKGERSAFADMAAELL